MSYIPAHPPLDVSLARGLSVAAGGPADFSARSRPAPTGRHPTALHLLYLVPWLVSQLPGASYSHRQKADGGRNLARYTQLF